MSSKFIFHLGPIVDFKYAYKKYFPFNMDGLFYTNDFIIYLQFYNNWSSVKSNLPICAWIFLPLSTLYVIWPALACFKACGNYYNKTSVPNLAFGMRPFGPNNFPYGFNLGTCDGVVNNF